MNPKHFSHLLALLLLGLLLCACKPGTPRDVLSESKMEEVLYDYHLAQALAKTAQGDSVAYQSRLLTAAVYSKHGIDAAQFDRSMEWYARHTEQLGNIYQRLAERMGDPSASVRAGPTSQTPSHQNQHTDTLLLYRPSSHILLQSQGESRYVFAQKVDTALQRGDQLRLAFTTALHRRGGAQQGIALLAVRYAGDSIAYTQQAIYAMGRQTVTLRVASDRKVEEVKGFVYLVSPWTERPCLFTVSDLSLSRIRQREQPPAVSPEPVALPARETGSDSTPKLPARTVQHLRDSLVREEQMQKRQPHFK